MIDENYCSTPWDRDWLDEEEEFFDELKADDLRE